MSLKNCPWCDKKPRIRSSYYAGKYAFIVECENVDCGANANPFGMRSNFKTELIAEKAYNCRAAELKPVPLKQPTLSKETIEPAKLRVDTNLFCEYTNQPKKSNKSLIDPNFDKKEEKKIERNAVDEFFDGLLD